MHLEHVCQWEFNTLILLDRKGSSSLFKLFPQIESTFFVKGCSSSQLSYVLTMHVVEHNTTSTREDVALAYKLSTSAEVGVPHTFVCAFVPGSVILLDDETSYLVEHSCKDMTKCSFVGIQPNINCHQKLLSIVRRTLPPSSANITGLHRAIPSTEVANLHAKD